MKFVESKDLKPGMRLAKPIYNKMGVLLYERNSYLTSSAIKSIENFGLIGIFILEPAEPLPPLSREDLKFEQLQTIYMFQIKDNMDRLQQHKKPDSLSDLADNIIEHFGALNHKINFTQNLRSSVDFVYKHSISTAILAAMISHALHVPEAEQRTLVVAALLYDIGYLYVPRKILDKKEPLTEDEIQVVHECRKKGFELLFPQTNRYMLHQNSLKIIQQTLNALAAADSAEADVATEKSLSVSTQILITADKFDRLTAMNLNHAPISEIAAVRYLKDFPKLYSKQTVGALSVCIHILPSGCSVDLSNGDKGIVLWENPENFFAPLILNIRTNKVMDLSDPQIAANLHVTDTMKTMDNRIIVDEETLKQFTADEHIHKMLLRIQEKTRKKSEQ